MSKISHDLKIKTPPNFSTSTPNEVENQQTSSWAGHFIRHIGHALAKIYEFLISKLAFSYIFKKSQESSDKQATRSEVLSSRQIVKQDFQEQIQKAEREVVKATKALDYAKRVRAKASVHLLSQKLHVCLNFENALKEACPQIDLSSSLAAAHELEKFLKQKEELLTVSIDSDVQFTTAEIDHHIEEIFNQVFNVYQNHIKQWANLLKGTPARKKFIQASKQLVEEYQNRKTVHQTPSSDSYLSALQFNVKEAQEVLVNVKEAQEVLDKLKQQQANLSKANEST